jgi:hypothetical protein
MDFKGLEMKTGFDIVEDDTFIKNILVLIGVFITDATRLGSCYCMHANRTSVTKEDIGFALKVRAFHGNSFWNSPNTQQKINEIHDLLDESESEIDSEEEEEEEEEEIEIENEEKWIKSECKCVICKTLNDIDTKWDTWEPTSFSDISIKNAINSSLEGL